VTICDYFRAKISSKFAISTGILLFSNFSQPLYKRWFCQYCWQKSEASKRFPVALPNLSKVFISSASGSPPVLVTTL
jgi:hypothetical protein